MGQLVLTFGVFLLVIGCDVYLHPYQDYLNQAVGQADHEAVARKMGAPHRTVALDKGGDLWTYDFCAVGDRIGSATCQNVNLIFDKSGKLAEWHMVERTLHPRRLNKATPPAEEMPGGVFRLRPGCRIA